MQIFNSFCKKYLKGTFDFRSIDKDFIIEDNLKISFYLLDKKANSYMNIAVFTFQIVKLDKDYMRTFLTYFY